LEKIPIPHAKVESVAQKRENLEAAKKRKAWIRETVSKEYQKHRPKIPLPENFRLLRRFRQSEISRRLVAQEQYRLKVANVKTKAIKNAAKYEKEYDRLAKELISNKRIARNTNSFYVEAEPKVVFVVRIRGINGVSPKVRKALQLLRLRQIHNGTFVKVNGASMQILKLVEPYITYGTAHLSTIKKLVYKRGHLKIGRSRIRITDNVLIHDHLGKMGIHCVEDVIHEIYTCGPHFKEVNNFLWPFKLSSPKGGYQKKRVHFVEGGDAGNREKYINKFVTRMI